MKLAGVILKRATLHALPWDAVFEDPEDAFALHRFAWLVPYLLDLSRGACSIGHARGLISDVLTDWMRKHPRPARGAAWHPYTVSERIVNWILATLACGIDWTAKPEWRASLIDQALYLRENLEYYGEGWTGNHLSNNGRALYAAGLLARHGALYSAGCRILLNERARLFDADERFLVEGSSHYHFLVTRNYCEALWLAMQSGDKRMEDALRGTVSGIVRGCWFYLVKAADGRWSFPLMGDISPDCAPQWLLGVPWVGARLCGEPAPAALLPDHGWHRLFLSERGIFGTTNAWDGSEIGTEWARMRQDDWTVFCHINPGGAPRWPGHTHQDTGGIVVYHRSIPIIGEAGRKHYVEDADGQWGKDCWAHSLLAVDGLNPAPYWRSFYPASYVRARSGEPPRFERNGEKLEVTHGGFSRSQGVGLFRRSVRANSNGALEIEDTVEGSGNHRIDLLFHLPGTAALTDDVFLIENGGWKGRLRPPRDLPSRRLWRGGPGKKTFGWGHFSYGEATPITSLRMSGMVRLPWRGLSILESIDS